MKLRTVGLAVTLGPVLVIFPLVGCHEFPDMTVDDLPPPGMVTTTSADEVRRMGVTGAERVRDYKPMSIESQDGTVAHGPLWLEDPFELVGSDDGQFAVTWEEGVYFFPLGMARFTANVLLLPLSMIVEPPGTVTCSDGRPDTVRCCGCSELRDSTRCSGVTSPPDVHELWGAGDEAMDADGLEPPGDTDEREGAGETPEPIDE